ncbi:unnamed protein product [Urochloa humidicola]
MAGTASAPCPLHVLGLYCLLVLCTLVPTSSSLSFSFNFSNTKENPCYTELSCKGDAMFANSMIELTTNDRSRSITWSQGQVRYATLVPIWNAVTGEVASFTSTFSFKITPDMNSSTSGDGMAFFLARHANNGVPDAGDSNGGGYLGLFNSKNYLNSTSNGEVVIAVEFDTYRNPIWDDSDQHVGIDVNSLKSVATTNTTSSELLGMHKNLTSGDTMTAWVYYDHTTKLLTVGLEIGGTWYNVSAVVDLERNLLEEVAVGFSAATGNAAELHRVLSWSFSSTLEKKDIKGHRLLLIKVLVVPIASVCGCAIILLLLPRQWQWQKPRNKQVDSESDEDVAPEAEYEKGVVGPRRYLYRELAAATADFSVDNMLGRGGFGSVYRGYLPSDHQVAIKKFSAESSQGRKEFEAEVKIISRLRHRNLVQLLGWCDSRKGLLLVYELVPAGSLDKHIYNNERLLIWHERYKIILGAGSALRYLHREWEQCVVHGDIKPSNIMLDYSYNSKLVDFGLARLVDHGTGPRTTGFIQGTLGYIDPEFVNTLRRSTESDVYSFGIVVLEIVSGRPPVDRREPSFMLPKWVWNHYSRGLILDAADVRLRGGDAAIERQMERALVVGLWCAHPDAAERPSITQAIQTLQTEDDSRLPALSPRMYNKLTLAVGEATTEVIRSSGLPGNRSDRAP